MHSRLILRLCQTVSTCCRHYNKCKYRQSILVCGWLTTKEIKNVWDKCILDVHLSTKILSHSYVLHEKITRTETLHSSFSIAREFYCSVVTLESSFSFHELIVFPLGHYQVPPSAGNLMFLFFTVWQYSHRGFCTLLEEEDVYNTESKLSYTCT